MAFKNFDISWLKQTFFMLNKEFHDKLLRSTNQRGKNNLSGLHSWETIRGCFVMGRVPVHLHLRAIPKVFHSLSHKRESGR